MKTISGQMTNCHGRYAIVAGRFNHFITDKLCEGAVDTMLRHGIAEDDISCVWVPGAFEMPQTVNQLLKQGNFDAIITLGAVIRGSTAHFDFVAGECARGIADINRQQDVPVIFGVLTTDTIEQAIERAGSKAGNKGSEAAITAMEMVSVYQQLSA